jgi:hypothetical protein
VGLWVDVIVIKEWVIAQTRRGLFLRRSLFVCAKLRALLTDQLVSAQEFYVLHWRRAKGCTRIGRSERLLAWVERFSWISFHLLLVAWADLFGFLWSFLLLIFFNLVQWVLKDLINLLLRFY